ncbi:inactive serine protease scarface [Hylaeus anthracinus]|uniref:inactive serine protease scarface n=1 Tax=Hylaeus anthracinus TaxID=313031 RepID=UPI0023B95126|nr:inactive serine protease scarface [Hylaeus anthracinus]
MLVRVLILITAIISANGFPSPNPAEYDQIVLQNPMQQEFDQQLVFQNPTQEEFIQQSTNEDYFDFDNTKSTSFSEQTGDFTISCIGENRICTKKNNCANGYILITEDIPLPSSKECRIRDEVCCTVVQEFRETSPKIEPFVSDLGSNSDNKGFKLKRPLTINDQIPENFASRSANSGTQEIVGQNPGQTPTNFLANATHVQFGCAAALLCVEEQYCTAGGTISTEPVSLEKTTIQQRVPLSSCKNPDNGIIGKCCRDPNYVDPWPTENLPKNYSGGFDEQGFPTFLNIAKVRPPKQPVQPINTVKSGLTVRPGLESYNSVPAEEKVEPALVPDNSVISVEVLVPPIETVSEQKNDVKVGGLNMECGVRNTKPGIRKSQTVFAEIPWQAMVLHSKEKKILCSGALISTQDILTAANCIDSLGPNDISIKLGEWKLGYELKHEEPLPYEILNVSSIRTHSGYARGYTDHDLAILHLKNPATIDLHVNPLCLPTTKQLQMNKCIATGWGKSILQAHYAGAIMHAVDLDILSTEQCQEQLISGDLIPSIANGIICGTPRENINNVCEADVGGPLACKNRHGLYELAGIYSQDTGCLPTNQIAIFAPLDDEWLKETMASSIHEQSLSTLIENSGTNKGYEELPFENGHRKSTLSTDNEYLPPN